MFESILCQVPEYDPAVLDAVIELAVEIAREGREGRRIGTLFTLGDAESLRQINDPNLRATIKELAQLDGAFVIDEAGVFVAACRYLDAVGAGVEIPLGMGSRHLAAANISSVTGTVGIVVSESSTVRIFCHGKMVGEIIPELWLLSRREAQMHGTVKRDHVGDMAVITPKTPDWRAKAEK